MRGCSADGFDYVAAKATLQSKTKLNRRQKGSLRFGLMGAIPTRHRMQYVSQGISPMCRCGLEREDAAHIYLRCPLYSECRAQMLEQYTLDDLMSQPACFRHCGLLPEDPMISTLEIQHQSLEEKEDGMPPDISIIDNCNFWVRDGRIVVATDGAAYHNWHHHLVRAGARVYWCENCPLNASLFVHRWDRSIQRAEIRALKNVVAWSWGPIEILMDSQSTIDIYEQVLNGKPVHTLDHADLWQAILLGVRAKGPNNFRITKVASHCTQAQVDAGTITQKEKEWNDKADALAKRGAKIKCVPANIVNNAKKRLRMSRAMHLTMANVLVQRADGDPMVGNKKYVDNNTDRRPQVEQPGADDPFGWGDTNNDIDHCWTSIANKTRVSQDQPSNNVGDKVTETELAKQAQRHEASHSTQQQTTIYDGPSIGTDVLDTHPAFPWPKWVGQARHIDMPQLPTLTSTYMHKHLAHRVRDSRAYWKYGLQVGQSMYDWWKQQRWSTSDAQYAQGITWRELAWQYYKDTGVRPAPPGANEAVTWSEIGIFFAKCARRLTEILGICIWHGSTHTRVLTLKTLDMEPTPGITRRPRLQHDEAMVRFLQSHFSQSGFQRGHFTIPNNDGHLIQAPNGASASSTAGSVQSSTPVQAEGGFKKSMRLFGKQRAAQPIRAASSTSNTPTTAHTTTQQMAHNTTTKGDHMTHDLALHRHHNHADKTHKQMGTATSTSTAPLDSTATPPITTSAQQPKRKRQGQDSTNMGDHMTHDLALHRHHNHASRGSGQGGISVDNHTTQNGTASSTSTSPLDSTTPPQPTMGAPQHKRKRQGQGSPPPRKRAVSDTYSNKAGARCSQGVSNANYSNAEMPTSFEELVALGSLATRKLCPKVGINPIISRVQIQGVRKTVWKDTPDVKKEWAKACGYKGDVQRFANVNGKKASTKK